MQKLIVQRNFFEDIKEDDVKKFLANLLSNRKYDPSSVGLARSALKFFYDDVMKTRLMADIKTPKKQRKLPDVLTKEEVRQLIEESGSLRNKLLRELMYSSGLRVSECASLKINDLNTNEKTGIIKLGKGGKDRFFILSLKLIEDLKEYLKEKLVEHLKAIPTEKSRKILMNKVFNPAIVSGSFKDYLKGDLKEADKKVLKEIISELKDEKFMYHIDSDRWVLL